MKSSRGLFKGSVKCVAGCNIISDADAFTLVKIRNLAFNLLRKAQDLITTVNVTSEIVQNTPKNKENIFYFYYD